MRGCFGTGGTVVVVVMCVWPYNWVVVDDGVDDDDDDRCNDNGVGYEYVVW